MKKEFFVKNLSCSGCAVILQDKISEMNGINDCNLDLYKSKLIVDVTDIFEEDSFLTNLNKIADKVEPGTIFEKPTLFCENIDNEHPCCGDNHNNFIKDNAYNNENENKKSNYELYIIAFAIIALLFSYYIPNLKIRTFLLVLTYIIVGNKVIKNCFKNILTRNFFNENFLMTIATFGAIYLGDYVEALGVMIFYNIGIYFEGKAIASSRKSIEKLLDIRTEVANLKKENGEIEVVESSKLKIDEIFVVKPGEKVPVDGVVVKGSSYLDLSPLTGESIPVEVTENSEISSGSINGDKVLEVRVRKLFENSTVSKIIEIVENANNKKAVSEKFITKFAKYYTPIVLSAAILVGIIIPMIFGNFEYWFPKALLFLVISCPCALVVSVPLTFYSSIGIASKNGLLIKGGNYLERVSTVDTISFDKTGTITKGKFKIEEIKNFDISLEELKELVKAGEFYSTHPIALAILSQIKSETDKTDKEEYENIEENIEENIKDYKNIPGKGVSLLYKNEKLFLGNAQLLRENKITFHEENYPETVVYIAKAGKHVGTILVSDEIKENSKRLIDTLRDLKIETYMITGDNENIALKVARNIGMKINNVFSNLLPTQKVEALEKIKTNSKSLVYIGDGINDAPVLAISDVGVAMGGLGSDAAIEAADIVIMDDDPYKIIKLISIAKENKRKVIINVTMALIFKVVVMIMGVIGLATMWTAIISDVGVSLLCILYGTNGFFRNNK